MFKTIPMVWPPTENTISSSLSLDPTLRCQSLVARTQDNRLRYRHFHALTLSLSLGFINIWLLSWFGFLKKRHAHVYLKHFEAASSWKFCLRREILSLRMKLLSVVWSETYFCLDFTLVLVKPWWTQWTFIMTKDFTPLQSKCNSQQTYLPCIAFC